MPCATLVRVDKQSEAAQRQGQLAPLKCICVFLFQAAKEHHCCHQHQWLLELAPMDLCSILQVNVEMWDPQICYLDPRFYCEEILGIHHQLGFPDLICLPNRSIENGRTALAVLFTCLYLPSRHHNHNVIHFLLIMVHCSNILCWQVDIQCACGFLLRLNDEGVSNKCCCSLLIPNHWNGTSKRKTETSSPQMGFFIKYSFVQYTPRGIDFLRLIQDLHPRIW